MGRMVKRLSGLEIDEVSLVDTPANQHGLVAIAKRQEQDTMADLFDADGQQVFEDELQHGDFVYNDAGEEFRWAEVDGEPFDDDTDDAVDDVDDRELAGVGKALFPLSGAKGRAAGRLARSHGRDAGRKVAAWGREAGERGRAAGNRAVGGAIYGASRAVQHVEPRRGRYGAAAGAAAGAGAGYAGGRVRKSLGSQVLEDLSKALTEDDRDQVIAKALNTVELVSKQNEQLVEAVQALTDAQEAAGYVDLAKSYELPVRDDALAGLLARASAALPQEDLDLLDRLFAATGDIAKNGGFEQYGFDADEGPSDVLGQVEAMAGQIVSKGAGQLTREQAVTAVFEANPDAYDEYEREQAQLRGQRY